ncbi:UDP-N-acetylmuramoyl-L-alanyl-D-glutamate--2,6-diaminopimelate ligase [Rossellomorea vietnamensis]|uniref:UDP-N-acetylmuramyl-tripeptide synthetase n=1 Tax=Rossellomorea vietnamensis TaxID=218284 RepID=A0A5D4KBX6_9BACI|nr:UDP-N-acetylmuramoyl-L-alanyl-D-glutamate--2,6-diaminopimelate ligase [Rossellomorea vietnamensis]TYR74818.1 UDP-N-acetylmuramoyl-L-alanyl-D-glutamate--2,6-diaminopimelate ligase [Rossellomorea vietnamensis]
MNIDFTSQEQLGIKRLWGKEKREISNVNYDSRRVLENAAFVCVSGEKHDGHSFLEDAIHNGAAVLAGENAKVLEKASKKYPDRTFLLVEDARAFLAQLSILFYKRIHEKLTTIGVTGTNGKTTVTAYVKSLMTLLGTPTGSIGTTGIISSSGKINLKKSTPTTPESSDLHYIFDQFYQRGDQAAAMEVSSVATEQKRVEGIEFDVAIHTNLSPEHLEFHGTFENYKEAKLKLFRQAKKAVVNIDDDGMGKDILDMYPGEVLTYSLDRRSEADVKASNLRTIGHETFFELKVHDESYIVRVPVIGNYNVANILAAICTALHSGYSIHQILLALPSVEGPEGRFEILTEYGNRKILLDYAHTPAALDNLLREVKKLEYKRLIVLITGIGIRDKSKMPLMAETIDGKADEIVVSVDHPDFTDPDEIISHVLAGFSDPSAENIYTERTRAEGVLSALSLSNEEDLILLTSGCINGAQIVEGKEIPHSDKEVIAEYFKDDKTDYDYDYIQA